MAVKPNRYSLSEWAGAVGDLLFFYHNFTLVRAAGFAAEKLLSYALSLVPASEVPDHD